MSSEVGDLCEVSCKSERWELAQRLVGHFTTPDETIARVFQDELKVFEKEAGVSIDPAIQKRVWKAVSERRITALKRIFATHFCEEVLSHFSESQIKAILREHRSIGAIKENPYGVSLQEAFRRSRDSLERLIDQRAKAMAQGLVPEILQALEKEGIRIHGHV